MNRSLGLGIAALLLVGLVLWWWSAGSTAPAGSGDAHAGTEPEPPAVEPAPAPHAAARPAAEAEAEAEPGEDPEPGAPAPADPAPPMPEPPSEPMGPVARLKHAFETDPVDPQAIAAERELRALVGGPEVPVEMLERVMCRKRACKLQLIWLPDKPLAFMGLGMKVSTEINPEIAVDPHEPDEKGVRRYDLYVPRDGYGADDLDPVPEPAKP
jgi:hypothetical protein